MNTKLFSVIFALLVTMAAARPQGTLAWSFDTTEFIVQPTDQILITCTVSNLSEQSTPISFGGASFGGPLQYFYDFSWMIAISDTAVPGHASLQFSFGTLTPIGSYVPPGMYYADPARINFTQIPSTGQLSENTFQISVVPEPTALCLATVGIVCLSARRLWMR